MHVRRLAGNHLRGYNALFLGFMGKHRTWYAIADCVDVGQIRAHLIVDDNLATLRQSESQLRAVDSCE